MALSEASMQDWSNSEIAMACAVALYSVKEFVVPAVKRAFAQNAEAREERLKKVEASTAQHEKDIDGMKFDRAQMNTTLGEIKGELKKMGEDLDRRIEKQGKAHDERLVEALQQLSRDFNTKLTTLFNLEMQNTVRGIVREELLTQRVSRKKAA